MLALTNRFQAEQLENWQSIISSVGLTTTVSLFHISGWADRGQMLQDTQDHVLLIQDRVREGYGTAVELRVSVFDRLTVDFLTLVQSMQLQALTTTKDMNYNLDGVQSLVSSIGDRLNETLDRLDELHTRGWWKSSSIRQSLFGLHSELVYQLSSVHQLTEF